MNVWHTLSLMVVVLLTLTSAKKNRKKGAAPAWKSTSMPFQNKRFEAKPEGENFKFDCKAQGHPKPNVQWLKDGIRIKNRNSPKMEVKKYGLTLTDLSMDMSGNYTCVVKNKHGQLEWTFVLEVQTKRWPLIVDGPHNITQVAGSDVVFTCRVLNDPSATIRWQRFEPDAPKSNKPSVDDFLPDGEDPHMLKLSNIQKEDEGEYRCMVGNIHGLKYSSAWLQVIESVILPNVPTRSVGFNNNNMWPYDDTDENGLITNPDDQFNFDDDRYYTTTTRRPRKNGRRKNGKRKNRKNKKKTPKDPKPTTTETSPTTTIFFTTLDPLDPFESSSVVEDTIKPTISPTIWRYNNEPTYDGFPDTRYNPNRGFEDNEKEKESADHSGMEGNLGKTKSKGDISAWKIYTIVGAIGGVILLIGLVAITIAICCPKQEGGVYKSTPV